MDIPIKGFIENSLIEWEGKIVSILFLPTCNLRCPYCHAPHLIQTPEELESIPPDVVISKIWKSCGWVDGVVISGGEPTLHKHLSVLIQSLKETGIRVRLDTNGTNPYMLEYLIRRNLLDCVAMDIKAPLRKEKYEQIAGTSCNIEDIKKSIQIIMQSGIEYEFRTTVCPSQLDGDDIEDIAMAIQGAQRYIIQSFRPGHCLDTGMVTAAPYPAETLRDFAAHANKYVNYCCVRGEEGRISQRNW
ncbi:MAG: anaerobic ribonucleoside-triphosphate reductase activating protein [Candidatus Loosdrechtia sp.]|uniref:anaerobic ribonucleoside-triphosphate reductase activating protein n=1 Tax=Candidatus Loosdrechtia sp. TaxID=3101272 RepID=UPI003A739E21|nr:MAG: anaerobic ribonucleoside-triphosphate reductase activating protein [Candidatus Jettenia sp. AMX2]